MSNVSDLVLSDIQEYPSDLHVQNISSNLGISSGGIFAKALARINDPVLFEIFIGTSEFPNHAISCQQLYNFSDPMDVYNQSYYPINIAGVEIINNDGIIIDVIGLKSRFLGMRIQPSLGKTYITLLDVHTEDSVTMSNLAFYRMISLYGMEVQKLDFMGRPVESFVIEPKGIVKSLREI